MKVERSTAVRSTATARRSGANNAAALQAPQQQQVVQNQSLTVPDLSGLNPTPPQFILPYQSGAGGQQIQQQTMQQPQQQILLPNMNEMPSQRLIRRGHQMELLAQAKVLCDHQDFVDLTIYCEDGVVRAHQMLLAVASPFLMMLFQSNPSYGNDDITLILPEVKACLVQALIHFVYTGVVVSNENHFYSLMKLVYALNINASIEAESTNDRATTFTAPLVPPAALGTVMRLSHQQPNTQQFSVQQGFIGQQSNLLPQPLLPQQPVPMSINGTTTTSNVNAVAAAAVAAITQPAIAPPNLVPPVSKAPRLSGPPANAMPVPIHNLTGTTTTNKLPIQLPTQPVPMVNGVVRGTESQHILGTAPPTQQYIAIDPTTGINYKVDMAMTNELGSADPLAAIMNETIFQDTSGAIVPGNYIGTCYLLRQTSRVFPQKKLPLFLQKTIKTIFSHFFFAAPNAQIYQTDSGQVIYTTQPPPNATGTIPTNIQIQQPQPLTSTPAQNKRGKKRGASKQDTSLNNNSPLANSTAPASILSLAAGESVDDLPCTPDDEDINTPYPCPSCNKTIKGKVMLQAHHYQEHYENTELNQMDVGDKHACRVCLKLFTRNSDVKAHILRVHCGDRRYPCTMCGKRFKESTHLRKHLYTHTGKYLLLLCVFRDDSALFPANCFSDEKASSSKLENTCLRSDYFNFNVLFLFFFAKRHLISIFFSFQVNAHIFAAYATKASKRVLISNDTREQGFTKSVSNKAEASNRTIRRKNLYRRLPSPRSPPPWLPMAAPAARPRPICQPPDPGGRTRTTATRPVPTAAIRRLRPCSVESRSRWPSRRTPAMVN